MSERLLKNGTNARFYLATAPFFKPFVLQAFPHCQSLTSNEQQEIEARPQVQLS